MAAEKRFGMTTLRQSFAWCRDLNRRVAGSFQPAFRLLPARERQAMEVLYAFMRLTDDLADEAGDLPQKRQALIDWRDDLDRARAGKSSHPCHPALVAILDRYEIPEKYLHAVVDGVIGDIGPVQLDCCHDLYRYCWNVASAVGLCCIRIWGCRDSSAIPAAEAAGQALQLTNILRDLGEDAGRGRIYLPRLEWERFESPPESWPLLGPNYLALMQFQTARARNHFKQARGLYSHLNASGQAVYQVMLTSYEKLLDAIEASGFDVFQKRIRLSKPRKIGLLLAAIPTRWGWR